jgi:hypothetical protein
MCVRVRARASGRANTSTRVRALAPGGLRAVAPHLICGARLEAAELQLERAAPVGVALHRRADLARAAAEPALRVEQERAAALGRGRRLARELHGIPDRRLERERLVGGRADGRVRERPRERRALGGQLSHRQHAAVLGRRERGRVGVEAVGDRDRKGRVRLPVD